MPRYEIWKARDNPTTAYNWGDASTFIKRLKSCRRNEGVVIISFVRCPGNVLSLLVITDSESRVMCTTQFADPLLATIQTPKLLLRRLLRWQKTL